MKQKIIFLALILFGSSMLAQTDNTLIEKLVEKNVLTRDEADDLLQEQSEESSRINLNNIKALLSRPYLQLGGYGLFTYEYGSQKEVKHNVSPRLVVLSIRGTVAKNVSYLVLMDFASPSLLEFNAEWKPASAFALKAGQFKTPFTLENQYSPTALETVNNTRSLAALAGMAGDPQQFTDSKFSNKGGRDLGVQISGEVLNLGTHNLFSYAGGVFQGQGINQRDVNNTKDFAGSLYLQPIKDLFVGGSVYFGQVAQYYTDYYWNGSYYDNGYKTQVRERWALSAKYSCEKFDARAEYIIGNDGGFDREGCYGTCTYKLAENKLYLVGKVDYFKKESYQKRDTEVLDYTAGLNYNFYKTCRLQLNYTYSDYNKNWAAKDCSSVMAQMQIVF